jgi:hypothetical protein
MYSNSEAEGCNLLSEEIEFFGRVATIDFFFVVPSDFLL